MKRRLQILGLVFSFSACFGCRGKNSVQQMREQVITKEKSFMRLVDDFESSLPDSNYIVKFGIGKYNAVNLTYYKNQGNVADMDHFGGQNLYLHSPELDDAIKKLGWTYETIDKLSNGLKTIQCDYIRNTDWFGKPINIYNHQGGFVNSAYNIYPTEMLDSVAAAHGEAIGQTDFLKRVYIMTSAAL